MGACEIKWLATPEEHDYPAALSYLSLEVDAGDARRKVRLLRRTRVKAFKAKDIFRASGLPLLGVSNSHVEKNIRRIEKGRRLSPILLVRTAKGLIVADGYHRLCAVYRYDEDALIPCKIV